jgi:glycosyltransferase involved in cell wall biosynthesis
VNRPRVVVVYKWIPQYRKRFFELLRESLADRGVDLVLVYGSPAGEDARKSDAVDISWGHHIRNRYLGARANAACWQPCLGHVRNADLVIVEQANRLLVNYLLIGCRKLVRTRVAFWGHGRNFQARPADGASERLKTLLARSVDWWFAYVPTSAEVVAGAGFPRDRITIVQNSVDTSSLATALRGVNASNVATLRASLGLAGNHVCIFCGSMYPEKRIPFLIDACARVRSAVPDFEMLFVGAGVDQDKVVCAADLYEWVHMVGPIFGGERAPYFGLAKLALMPGLVGLGVVDSFVAGVPMVTTSVSYHSPEIEYLRDGVNGLIVDETSGVQGYAQSVIDLLADSARRKVLVEGCERSAQVYTIEAMVRNFSDGVMRALEA